MKIRNVLVFPAGTEIGLEIYESLRSCKEVKLIGAGLSASNHGQFAYEQYFNVPSIHEDGWLQRLIEICNQEDIDFIFPAYDDVIVSLAMNADKIPAKILTSSLEVCLLTRSKKETYSLLNDVVRVPQLYEKDSENLAFPLFVKPERGQGSFGARKVNSYEELSLACNAVTDPIVCEFLPGEEYTVDCFSDLHRGLVFAGARKRNRTRNGISVNTNTIELEGIYDLADAIQKKLHLVGAWFFQVKHGADGGLVLLEVAPRIAGSMSTYRVRGINFPLLTIFAHEELPIQVLDNKEYIELDRALRNRFKPVQSFSHLYIDLDDTIILNGKINLDAIKLIYQCINNSIFVKLITRHDGDLGKTLSLHRIAHLFDEIIHIRDRQPKSDYIRDKNAIFVDDSFAERKDVTEKLGIRTYDCSMIELLLNSTSSHSAV